MAWTSCLARWELKKKKKKLSQQKVRKTFPVPLTSV